jgi:hypothetical protein
LPIIPLLELLLLELIDGAPPLPELELLLLDVPPLLLLLEAPAPPVVAGAPPAPPVLAPPGSEEHAARTGTSASKGQDRSMSSPSRGPRARYVVRSAATSGAG